MTQQYLSKKEILKELLVCGRDPIYFIDTYCKITDPAGQVGLIPFKTWGFQKDLIQNFKDYQFNIILKSRQLGISTIVAAYASWLMLFHRERNIMVMATQFKTAGTIVKKVKGIIKHLPPFFNKVATIKFDNRTNFTLTNGSEIKASTTSADAGRSETLSLLIVDEAAHVEELDEIWAALGPTMAAGGRCIALSSPNGVGNWFHKTYTDAEMGLNDFHPTKLNWDVHPGRDQAWLEKERRAMPDKRKFAQEYECVKGATKTITYDGYKEIKDIQIGDLVLTHKGRFRKVLNVFKRKIDKNELIKIITPLSRKNPIFITKNHPIATFIINNLNKGINGVNFNENKIDLLSWKDFNSLEKLQTEYKKYFNLLLPNIKKENILTNSITSINKESLTFSLDRYFGKFLGLFLSEGNYRNSFIQLSFHSKENELHDFVENFCKKFNINFRKQIRKNNCIVFYLKNKILIDILKTFIEGKYCYNKYFKDIIYDTNEDFIKGIIEGVWLGDGLHIPIKKNILSLTSGKLIYQLRTLMLLFGLITRVSFKEYNKEYNKEYKKQYLLELNNINKKTITECLDFYSANNPNIIKQSRTKIVRDGLIGMPNFYTISEIDDLENDIEVYNLHIEEDESYVVENLVVHNCSFLASGRTVIDPDILKTLESSFIEPKFKTGFDRNLYIWEEFKIDNAYLLTGDVARGDGSDFSAFHVFKLENMEQVAEYQGKITTDFFSKLLVEVGQEYNNCMIVIENNTLGHEVCNKLIEMKYPNIYFSVKGTHEYVPQYQAETMNNTVAGFAMSMITRPLVIAKFEEFIRNNLIKFNSQRIIKELKTFIWNNSGKPEAMRGYNDDLILSAAIACWIRETVLNESIKNVSYKKAMLNAIVTAKTNMNTKMPGMQGFSPRNNMINIGRQEYLRQQQQYSWVYKG